MLAIDWRRTNPDVESQQTNVDLLARRRKRNIVLEGYAPAINRKLELKKIKLERRTTFIGHNDH